MNHLKVEKKHFERIEFSRKILRIKNPPKSFTIFFNSDFVIKGNLKIY